MSTLSLLLIGWFVSRNPLWHISMQIEKSEQVHVFRIGTSVHEARNEFSLQVILKNRSSVPIKLVTPFNQHYLFDFSIAQDGKQITQRPYRNLFAFYSLYHPCSIVVPPNGTYTTTASLIGIIPIEHRKPGRFDVIGSIQYNGLLIKSNKLELETKNQ